MQPSNRGQSDIGYGNWDLTVTEVLSSARHVIVNYDKRRTARHWATETLTTKTGMSTRGGGLVLGRRSDVDSATVGASRPAWRLGVGPTSQLLRRVANDLKGEHFSSRP